MCVLASADHKRMPWKNGGGETVEVFVHPPGAGLSDFDGRVSMAHVAADGPFSRFEGIDRTLALLSGDGLRLEIEGRGETLLTVASAPLSFPADTPTDASLAGGPITDLNVMTRRGTLSHHVERFEVDAQGGIFLAPRPARWSLLLAAGPCRIERDGRETALAAFDAVLYEGDRPPLHVRAAETHVSLYAITISG